MESAKYFRGAAGAQPAPGEHWVSAAHTQRVNASGRKALFPVPVWLWRMAMGAAAPLENRRFNAEPITTVDYTLDVDYVGDGMREHCLDVLRPRDAPGALPVYVYVHGGGWTSGDKAPLTKYCAVQADSGMVVVNVNYRRAGRFERFHLRDMLLDLDIALAWVERHIGEYSGDPERIVLGGDSAGAQIVALLAAMTSRDELVDYYQFTPAIRREQILGLVLHCGAMDFSEVFERGFIMGESFVRILIPGGGRGASLRKAARWLSPLEWIDESFPPVLVTTSERDIFYRANLNFIDRAKAFGVPVDVLVYGWDAKGAEHTWQQDARLPESRAVYSRLQAFVNSRARQVGV